MASKLTWEWSDIMETSKGINSFEDLIKVMIDRVKTEKVEFEMTVHPDKTEIIIRPWEKFEIKCPYGK